MYLICFFFTGILHCYDLTKSFPFGANLQIYCLNAYKVSLYLSKLKAIPSGRKFVYNNEKWLAHLLLRDHFAISFIATGYWKNWLFLLHGLSFAAWFTMWTPGSTPEVMLIWNHLHWNCFLHDFLSDILLKFFALLLHEICKIVTEFIWHRYLWISSVSVMGCDLSHLMPSFKLWFSWFMASTLLIHTMHHWNVLSWSFHIEHALSPLLPFIAC